MLATSIEKNFSKSVNLSNVREFVPAIHARDLDITQYSHFLNPRMFRNEGPVYPDLYPKTIYIIRDPRAAYVSYYHHYLHDVSKEGNSAEHFSLEGFVEELITYGCLRDIEPFLIRWDRQVLEWLDRAKIQPVKVVKYEDMKTDPHRVLKEVLAFIGFMPEADEIDRIVQRGSFDNMRTEEETFGAEPYSGTKGERGFFVRKGKIDGWKEELSTDLAKKIEDTFMTAMKKVGYL
jgi:hypothetical protein